MTRLSQVLRSAPSGRVLAQRKMEVGHDDVFSLDATLMGDLCTAEKAEKALVARPRRHKFATSEHDTEAILPETRSVKKANSQQFYCNSH